MKERMVLMQIAVVVKLTSDAVYEGLMVHKALFYCDLLPCGELGNGNCQSW